MDAPAPVEDKADVDEGSAGEDVEDHASLTAELACVMELELEELELAGDGDSNSGHILPEDLGD